MHNELCGVSFERARRNGPKIVAIGGGNGLASMLRGLKRYTENITAIVTVADDGGSSGMLREDLGILPPGDVRNCVVALSNTEPIISSLLDYRFAEGSLSGHNVGNLMLAALNDICGSFNVAVTVLGEVIAMTGRVLPVTLEDVHLEAEFENGVRAVGESTILEHKKQQNCRVKRVRLIPDDAVAQSEVLKAVKEADMVIFGPGSLYTSIIPNLLVKGLQTALKESGALKVYVCNVMTQEGETEGYTVSDHVKELFKHSFDGLFSVCLANSGRVSKEMLKKYRAEDAEQTKIDAAQIAALGVELVKGNVFTESGGVVRHDPIKLAKELLRIHASHHDRGIMRVMDEAMLRYIDVSDGEES